MITHLSRKSVREGTRCGFTSGNVSNRRIPSFLV